MKLGLLVTTLVMAVAGFVSAGSILANNAVEISAIWPETGLRSSDPEVQERETEVPDLGAIAFSATIGRPLFMRGRRKFVPPKKPKPVRPKPIARPAKPRPPPPPPPAPPPPPPPPEPMAPPPDVSLIGVSLRLGDASALLTQDGGENLWVSRGDVLASWTIEDIFPDSIVLSHRDQEIQLRLYDVGETE